MLVGGLCCVAVLGLCTPDFLLFFFLTSVLLVAVFWKTVWSENLCSGMPVYDSLVPNSFVPLFTLPLKVDANNLVLCI